MFTSIFSPHWPTSEDDKALITLPSSPHHLPPLWSPSQSPLLLLSHSSPCVLRAPRHPVSLSKTYARTASVRRLCEAWHSPAVGGSPRMSIWWLLRCSEAWSGRLGEVLSDDSYTDLRSVLPTGGPSVVLHQTQIPCLLPAPLPPPASFHSLSLWLSLVCLSRLAILASPSPPSPDPPTPLALLYS